VLKWKKLPGFAKIAIVHEKKRQHTWDTHYQFSIKTLLSNEIELNGQKAACDDQKKKRRVV